MVDIIITDVESKVGLVLKTKYYEDALKLINTLYQSCVGFGRLSVTIERKSEEEEFSSSVLLKC